MRVGLWLLLVADLFFFFEDTAYSAGYTLGIPRGKDRRGRDKRQEKG